jgi:hypothetical protein
MEPSDNISPEVSHLEGTLRSAITVLPLVAFMVGVVSYSFNLQSQINVLQVRQENAIVQNRESLVALKEDIRDIAEALRTARTPLPTK